MADDEYELMPANELAYLRHEVEKLKRNPLGDTQASINLLDSINKLNANISRMNDILAGANDDMVKTYADGNLQSQLAKLVEQQEKLAKGIVAVGELVKKLETERGSPLPTLDSLVPKPQPVQSPPMQIGPLPTPEPIQQTNPFDPTRQPILNEPLPRPNGQFEQPMPRTGPNPFIPDADIPPPPPRRR